jgi:TonB family protein
VAAIAALVAVTVAATPAQTDGIDAVLARPVSPGTLALLQQYSKDPRTPARWTESLSHADPHVRATAARLLRVWKARGALPALTRALGAESDVASAIEIAAATVSLGASNEDRAALEAAKRLSASRIGLVVATMHHEAAIEQLPLFDQLKLSPGDMDYIVSSLASKDAGSIDRVAQAVAKLPSRSAWWEEVLAVALRNRLAVAPASLEAALVSDSSAVRDATWWYVAISSADERAPWKQLPADPAPSATLLTTEAAFARELAARAYKARPKPQPAFESLVRSGVELSVPSFAGTSFGGPLYRLLTKSEREVLKVEEPQKLTPARMPTKVHEAGPNKVEGIRTIGDLPAGYVADVLEQSGCRKVDSGDIAGAVVRFQDNMLKDLQWAATTLPPECDRAARYIASADLLPEQAMTSGELEFIAVPMHRSFLECQSRIDPPRPDASPVRVGRVGHQDIKPPTKTRHVAPVYPQAAIDARRQGIVIIESTIGPAGCVSQAKVLRSVATDLDIAALRAVTAWEFTPTLLNGAPVPVIMTVTVQFTLQ